MSSYLSNGLCAPISGILGRFGTLWELSEGLPVLTAALRSCNRLQPEMAYSRDSNFLILHNASTRCDHRPFYLHAPPGDFSMLACFQQMLCLTGWQMRSTTRRMVKVHAE